MADVSTSKPHHLEPSALGTKEYWDNLYTTEITNHTLDPSDEGTIWFGDSAAEDKVLSFLSEQIIEKHVLGKELTRENCSFLDLGTGNGHFLFRLRESDDDEEERVEVEEEDEVDGEQDSHRRTNCWNGRMLGVDYSAKSIEFARRIAADKHNSPSRKQSQTQEPPEIEFQHWDLITQPPYPIPLNGANETGWDVVLDKGTFDAISLSDETDPRTGRRICESYKDKVVPLIRDGGILLVTSCNWTEEELKGWFVDGFGGEGNGNSQGDDNKGTGGEGEGRENNSNGRLEVLDSIKYKSFSFGGRKGQSVSSVCFRKQGTLR